MEGLVPKITVRDIFGYLVAYMFWLLTASLSMLALLMIRIALNVAWPVMGGNRWVLRAVDRFGLVFLGLVWLVYVIFVEQYYRSSITAVRVRRTKEREHPALQAEAAQEKGLKRMLRKLGLDILAQRLVPTIGIPLAVLLVAYLIQQLVFAILAR